MRNYSSGKSHITSNTFDYFENRNCLKINSSGTRGERDPDLDYRGGADDEAMEDDDVAIMDDDGEAGAGSEEEADGEDLIENMEQ